MIRIAQNCSFTFFIASFILERMKKCHKFLFLLIITSIFFLPGKSFFEFNESKPTQLTMLTQNSTCPNHLSTNSSCATSTSMYWLEAKSDLLPDNALLIIISILSFILLYSRYNSPTNELFRPPICQ
ncbi:MAG: hypothetical protein A3F46_06655 [Legionellales bacterium RIFCSPHIGHO2_12_FULL_42_9]|nr:MAG: hypothetical protein A3F46_06655 [Legionellales bacterium RIFCSPHIGHO2_12_FULL_42_9]